ncbi:MAG: SpoIIE family protein phosphatase [Flavobacteriales bacterium]|nr:SpoIIE family protein phosphatase [Flavobacteriales bacterium]
MSNYSKLILILGVIYSLFPGSLNAQRIISYGPPKKVRLETPFKGMPLKYLTYQFDISTGLNTNSIFQITEDDKGRIWFGTSHSGFGCLDGENFYAYGAHNGFFERSSRINSNGDGSIWIGGNGIGVSCLKDGYKNVQYIDIGNTISDVHIQGIKSDSKNNVWVSTRLGGVSCIKKDTTLMWNHEAFGFEGSENDKRAYIRQMTIDAEDRVWGIVDKKVFYIENGEIIYPDYPLCRGKKFKRLGADGEDYIIALDEEGQFYKLTPQLSQNLDIKFPIPDHPKIELIKTDRNGVLFMSTSQHLFRVIGLEAEEMLNNHRNEFNISDFYFDRNNSLWIGTSGKGLLYIPKFNLIRVDGLQTLRTSEHLKLMNNGSHFVNISLDEKGFLKYDTLQKISDPNPQIDAYELSKGMYLTVNNKSYFFDKNGTSKPAKAAKYSQYYDLKTLYGINWMWDKNWNLVFENESGKFITTSIKGRESNLFHRKGDDLFFWSTPNHQNEFGIYRSNSKGETETVMEHILGDSLKLTGFKYVNDTTFLISSWGYFLFKVTPHTAERFSRNLGSNILYNFRLDQLDGLWVGGIEGGLNYFNAITDSAVNIQPRNGLSGGRLTDLRITKDNNALVGTQLGIDIFRLINQDQTVKSEEDFFQRYKHTSYTFKNGLIGQGFRDLYQDQYGNVWFSGYRGVPHILLKDDSLQLKPQHLLFESIILEERDGKHKTLFDWIPGREYQAPTNLSCNYDESLLLTVRSVYFENHAQQAYSFKLDDNNWTPPHKSSFFRLGGLSSGEHQLAIKAIGDHNLESEVITIKVMISGPLYQSALFWSIIIPLFLLLIYLIFRWRLHILKEREKQLEQTIKDRTEEIQLQKVEIETQHNEIKDSISYAKRIQEAILPAPRLIKSFLPESFVLYRPKDIVAGDFYWFESIGDTVIFAAADCTGHGVPGAMVSVVCHNALNRAVREFKLTQPDQILNKTRELVIETFEKSESNVKDGMDIAICSINTKTLELNFAGANNPIYIVNEGELNELKGDKQPVGIFENPRPFTNHTVQLKKGNLVYSFTDGFADQFGGEKGKKFKYRPFKELLVHQWQSKMSDQHDTINDIFESWKGDLEQVDDVCIIGIRL